MAGIYLKILKNFFFKKLHLWKEFSKEWYPQRKEDGERVENLSQSPRGRLGINQCAYCKNNGHWKKNCLQLKHKSPHLMAITDDDWGGPEDSYPPEPLVTAKLGNEEVNE